MVLVFCTSGSLRGRAAVPRHCHSFAFDLFPQTALERAARHPCIVWHRSFWLLRLGRAHVCKRLEPLRTARFFDACFFSQYPFVATGNLLVWHALEREDSPHHRHAICTRFRFSFLIGRIVRDFSRAPRVCGWHHGGRVCYRPLPPRHGSRGDIRDSRCAILLVPENVRPPPERNPWQASFLAYICGRVYPLYVHALAWPARSSNSGYGRLPARGFAHAHRFRHNRDCLRANSILVQLLLEPAPRRICRSEKSLARHHPRMVGGFAPSQ